VSVTVAYLILVQASVFAIGASLAALALLAIRRPGHWYWYFLTKLGTMGVIGILLYAISSPQAQRSLEANGRFWFYVSAVMVYAVGVTGVARDITRRSGARVAKGEPPPEFILDDES
jgi:hypothetical protein